VPPGAITEGSCVGENGIVDASSSGAFFVVVEVVAVQRKVVNGGGQHYPARKGGAVFPNQTYSR